MASKMEINITDDFNLQTIANSGQVFRVKKMIIIFIGLSLETISYISINRVQEDIMSVARTMNGIPFGSHILT